MRRTVAVAMLALAAACGSTEAVIDPGDGGRYEVALEPADFVSTVDNPWMPMTPGTRWVFEARRGGEVERVEVVVTAETREILGITATVVRDTVSVGGEVVEDTLDWYAQDRQGNVWYLGEDSKEYENGEVVSRAGSWEAGVDGAMAGIVMRANPRPGDAYRQEFLLGEAEDMAEVIRTDGSEVVPFGAFEGLLVSREWTPLEPDVVEEKYYARGVGLILEVQVAGGSGRTELVEHQAGG